MKQLKGVWRNYTTDNVEADESFFVLNLAADREPMAIKRSKSDVGRFESFVDKAS